MTQVKTYGVSRRSTLILLLTQTLVLVPVIHVVPVYLLLLMCLSFGWRIFIWYGRGSLPTKVIRLLLICLAAGLIIVSFGGSFNLNMAVAVLVTGYALKILEMNSTRDALVVIFIGFFIVATGGIYSQSLIQGLYLLLCVLALVAAMHSLYVPCMEQSPFGSIRLAALLILQAIPLTLVLFVFIPRFGPLWAVNWSSSLANTGLSDSMSPGDIAHLSRSPETVFRAEFNGEIPKPEARYWRTIVLDQYDGRTWYKSDFENLQDFFAKLFPMMYVNEGIWQSKNPISKGWWRVTKSNVVFRYRLMLEPHGERWLPSLGPVYVPAGEDTRVLRTMNLETVAPVVTRGVYQLETNYHLVKNYMLPLWMKSLNTFLPESGNPKSRKLAIKLFQSSGRNPRVMAENILSFFSNNPFYYTLTPPLMGKNEIDDFLFDKKQGFCEHYATSFVFLMRFVGIPARVITGFQGGKELAEERVLLVRQLDAHAWVEIWIDGTGWVTFDPTSAVSPERIRSGLEDYALSHDTFYQYLPWTLKLTRFPLYKQIQLGWEQLEYQWQKTVIQYMEDQQKTLMRRMFASSDYYWLQMGVMGILFATVWLIIIIVMVMRKRELPKKCYLWLRFEQKLLAKGIKRKIDEGPNSFVCRVSKEYPASSEVILAFGEEYIRQAYSSDIQGTQVERLRRLLNRL